jgi:hypothetical protein
MKQTSSMWRRFFILLFLVGSISCQKKLPPVTPPPVVEPPPHHVHKETKINTPLLQAKEPPLDVYAACLDPSRKTCSILILSTRTFTIIDWEKGSARMETFPSELLTLSPSRAASGKIIPVTTELADRLPLSDDEKQRVRYIITNNDLESPVFYDAEFTAAYPVPCKSCPFPVAVPGFNTFALRDGKFFDFEILPANEMATIDQNYHLNVRGKGHLANSDIEVGGTLCASLPFIYTSSHTLPGQPDIMLKFRYENGSLTQESSHQMDGEILDLFVFDLNQDGIQEMIVTLKKSNGIFLDVLEDF